MVKEQLNILNGHDGSELQKMLNGKWIREICKEFGSRVFMKVPLLPPLDRFIIPIALDGISLRWNRYQAIIIIILCWFVG